MHFVILFAHSPPPPFQLIRKCQCVNFRVPYWLSDLLILTKWLALYGVFYIFVITFCGKILLLAWIVQLINLWLDMWYEHRKGVRLKKAHMTMKLPRSRNGNP
jgi:hypothetical protein